MEAIHFWGIWPPSRFYEASIADQALALQFYMTKQEIAAYQSKVDEVESKRRMNVSDHSDN